MDRPTVLLVGGGERMMAALEAALERHDMMVETVPTGSALEAAFVAAPDLLVLVGDAANDGGHAVLARLGQNAATAMVPVVLLTDAAGLDRRLDAFRHGVVAVVPKTASADGMARRIAELARELPERSGETGGELGEASVDELVSLFSEQLRSGILSVTAGEGAGAQVVLRAGRPVTEAIEDLVARLRPLIKEQPGPLRYEFHESPAARLNLLDDEGPTEDIGVLKGRRILVIERNPARADVLVQELRARGALVVVVDGEGAGLERARSQDPEVVLIDGSGVQGWALNTLRTLRRDPRLRWASLLVVDAAELWPGAAAAPDLARLAKAIRPLVSADQELAARAATAKAFDTRLELVGPIRLLRALISTGLGLRLTVSHPRARVEIDLAEGLIAGAQARTRDGKESVGEGPTALAALLALGSGRVRIERKDAPATANVMAPLDDALAAATREEPPIPLSVLPPRGAVEPIKVPKPPNAPELARPSQAPDNAKLIGRLEHLLERLQQVLPAAQAAVEGVEPPPPKPDKPKTAPPPPVRSPAPVRGRVPTLKIGSSVVAAIAQAEPRRQEPPRVRPPSPMSEEDESIPFVIEATIAAPPAREPPKPPPAPPPLIKEATEAPSRRGWLWAALAVLGVLVIAAGGTAAWFLFLAPRPRVARLPTVEPAELPESTSAVARRVSSEPTSVAAPVEPEDAGVAEAALAANEPAERAEEPVPAEHAEEPPAPSEQAEEPAPSEQAEAATEAELAPENDVRHLIRAANYQRSRGNHAVAERHYLRVLRLSPRNQRALAGLTHLNIDRRNGTQAVRWGRRLVAADGRNPNNHVLLGDAYEASRNHAAARREWERAQQIVPNHAAARRRLRRP